MTERPPKSSTENNKELLGGVTTINDLKELDLTGYDLSPQQRMAIKNFDRYRLTNLKATHGRKDFQRQYLKIQAEANLSPYEIFLTSQGG